MKNILLLLFLFCMASSLKIRTSTGVKEVSAKSRPGQVPVLCYHNISNYPGKEALLYISVKEFYNQMKGLYDSGYHTILPDQLVSYYENGSDLPSKAFLLTLDDGHESHYSAVEPVLQQFGFKAVFFVNTISLNHNGFMSSNQLKLLAQKGHIIGAHTYDHPNLKKKKQVNWNKQLTIPKKVLESITGKTVDCFAYPYGEYNINTIKEVKSSGYQTAFQLTGRINDSNKLLTLRRIMVNGKWPAVKLMKQMSANFR